MSVLLNFGAAPSQAASARAASAAALIRQMVVNEERREQRGEIDDRVAEGASRERVAVGEVDAHRVADEHAPQHQRLRIGVHTLDVTAEAPRQFAHAQRPGAGQRLDDRPALRSSRNRRH